MPFHLLIVNRRSLIVDRKNEKTINNEPRPHQNVVAWPRILTINKRLQPAFTLIEILLTLFFSATLAILLLIAASTLIQTHRSNLQTIASRIGTKEVETLRNTAYTSLPASGSLSDPDIAKLPGGSATRTIASYQSSADIKQATVTVNWNQKGLAQTIILETLIYKDGI